MKVLAIIGSPRKGNTYYIVQQIQEQLQRLGEIEFEYLLLKDAYLESCRGCFLCFAGVENACPLKDDRATIEAKMLQANGVIFACPVYAMNVSALMKNFMDRFAHTFHRPRFFDQRALLVATTGGIGLRETLNALSALAAAGFQIVHKLGVRTPPFPVTPEFRRKTEKEIEKAARIFYQALNDRTRPTPTFGSMIQFAAFKTVIPITKDHLPYDYEYWKDKGWLESSYFYETEISLPKKITAWVIEKMIKRDLLKVYNPEGM